MATYKITKDGDTLKVGFADPGTNDLIVKDAAKALADLDLTGGKIIKIDGPASLPVACVLAHVLAHKFGAVAVKDPKLGKFVIAISHDPDFALGALIN